jgi:hypothetical protein
LFVGRLAYRFIQINGSTDQTFTAPAMLRSPLTVGSYFVLMGYYVCYYSVVLWKSKQAAAAGAEATTSLPSEAPRD